MPEIIKPLTFDDLPVRPPFVGRPKISDDIQQTAALLVGWDKVTRRLVSVSPTGVLHVAQPVVKGITNLLSNDYSYNWNGGDISTSEVMIKANPDNVSRIWVNVGVAAAPNIGHPLDAGESVVLSINNLHSLHVHIVNTGERASVVYTK